MTSARERREDVLVSVCFPAGAITADEFDTVRRTAQAIDQAFRYWELILIADGDQLPPAGIDRHGEELRNLRWIRVRAHPGFYRRRALAAAEAIGDVVILTGIGEHEPEQLVELAHQAADGDTAIVCADDETSVIEGPLAMLGAAAGFDVSVRDTLTAAFPRAILNRLLAHPERDLALRFPPRDEGFAVRRQRVSRVPRRRRATRQSGRRVALAYRLLVSSAPLVLAAVGILSLLTVAAGIAFALYSIAVWLFMPHVQPGWFSTAIVQSLTAAFLGFALFGVSTGMQKIMERLDPAADDLIVDEIGTIDLFGRQDDLNVDIDAGIARTPR
jgi:hypothetical protein